MGLDMYLTKRIYIGAEFEHRDVKGTIFITANGKPIPINFDKVMYIEENVMYWRKANQIHKWFVDNAQDGIDDCRSVDVSREQLQELLTLCEEVKNKSILVEGKVINGEFISNPEIAEQLLPSTEGFFFGSSAYDEWYLKDIQETIEGLREILKEEDGNEYCYRSSW